MIRSLSHRSRAGAARARRLLSPHRPRRRARCRRLRANVTVTGDVVRIGDLVDNAGAVADVPIFRSPDLGTRGAVATDRIVEAIRPHQLIGIDTRGLAEVIVTRASRAITAQEISGARRAGAGRPIRPRRSRATSWSFRPRRAHAASRAERHRRIAGGLPRLRPAHAAFRRDFRPAVERGAAPAAAPLYRHRATRPSTPLTVEHPVERGEVLKASDLVIVRRPKADGPSSPICAPRSGLRHGIRCGPDQPLRRPT